MSSTKQWGPLVKSGDHWSIVMHTATKQQNTKSFFETGKVFDMRLATSHISPGKPLSEGKAPSDPDLKSKKLYGICRFHHRQVPHKNRQDIRRVSSGKRFWPSPARCHTLGAMRLAEERENHSHQICKRHATYPPNMDGDRRIWRPQIDSGNAIRWMTRFNEVNRPSCIKVWSSAWMMSWQRNQVHRNFRS